MSDIVCCTGHRPGDRFPNDPETFKRLVSVAYDWMLDEQPDTILTGMALGWDTAVATAAIEHGISVIAYIPFIGQADRWSKADNERYVWLLERCASKKLVSRAYHPAAFQRRNEEMVDDCDRVLALWDGERKGGTWNCIEYGEAMDREIENLWEKFKGHA